MAEVTRRRLSRGQKLEVDTLNNEGHVFPELADMATELSQGRISGAQMASPNGRFHLFLHLPVLDADYYYIPGVNQAGGDPNYGIPFMLPPLRDNFAYTTDDDGVKHPVLDENVPFPVLESVSFGFDTRSEPAAIAGRFYGAAIPGVGTDPGGLDYALDAYAIRLAVVGRIPQYFKPVVTTNDSKADVEVWSGELTPDGFAPYGLRDNPVLFDGINKPLNPWLSYMFVIRAPLLLDVVSTKHMAMPSVTVDLGFRMPLMAPTNDIALAQNRPTRFAQASPSVTIDPPEPGESIRADGEEGIQTNLDNIDDVFAAKLGGGIGRYGEGALDRVLGDYSGYDVIAVPLFNNRLDGGITGAQVATEPYSAAATDSLWDRRRVVLTHPFVLHRAILAWNWQRWNNQGANAGTLPANPTFRVDVGVGIGAGLQSDSGIVYDDIATHTMTNPRTPATWETRLIDKISIKDSALAGMAADWELELHELLMVGALTGAESFHDQGERIYMGQTWTPLEARENLGGGVPNCAGAEQFIEVRMKIQDSTGPAATEVVSGYGGHWVYLIGRKYLTR